MALDKNDGTFSPSIEGVISGKTSQVDGMNGLLNDLIGNDNYLKDNKLDRGNYTGTAEKLHTDSNSIWGGLDGGGLIEDPSVTKVVGKRYIGADGKAYICLKPSNINNLENYMPCNVVDNLDKLKNLEQVKLSKSDNISLINGSVVPFEENVNLDTVTRPFIYYNATSIGRPDNGSGYVINFTSDNNGAQLAISNQTASCKVRRKFNGVWSEWVSL